MKDYYKVRTGDWANNIEKVQIDKESESSVWINGRRYAKDSNYDCYRPTFIQSRSFLLADALNKVQQLENRLFQAQVYFKKIQDIEEF